MARVGQSRLVVEPEASSAAFLSLDQKLPSALGRNNPSETRNHLLLKSLIQKILPCHLFALQSISSF